MEAPLLFKRILYPARKETREIHFDGLSATVHDNERFNLCRELVLQRVYEVAGLPSGTVLDCGANVGLFSLTAFQQADRVIAVEPDPAVYPVLAQNIGRNDAVGNVELIQAAVWTEDGEVSFDGGPHPTGGGIDAEGPLQVKSVALDSLCEKYGPIDLLKLDIEGAEEEVLVQSRLDGVKRIIAELHLRNAGDELPMIAALEDRGFEVELIPASDLYKPHWAKRVLQNWSSLKGELMIKLGVLVYLVAPLDKPRRPGRDMPFLVARR